jgi:NAD(P)-dependent dehydrogenase (short-subunit alcohol dehydrogenase family)/nitroreductase
MNLTGTVALVTGAASGVGRASAIAFARAGAAAVVIVDIDDDGAHETAGLVKAAGADALAIHCDVSDPSALAAAFEEAERAFGGLDVVHNNAGLAGNLPAWPATPLARLHAMVGVNLGGVVYGTHLGVAALRRRGGGAIVNTASLGGLAPYKDDAAYAAAKAGVIMLTRSCRSLRHEGIRVNAVCPGAVDTPLLRGTGGGTPAAWLSGLDGLHLLSPEDVARAVLEVVTDEARAGEAVIIDNVGRAEVGAPTLTTATFADVRPKIFGPRAGSPAPPSFDDVVHTTRAMRRLRTDPVPTELLSEIIEAATMGPCGNHVEIWRFYVLTDRARIEQLAGLWSAIFDRVKDKTGSMPEALRRSCEYMIEHFAEVPAVILPGAVGFPGPDANVVETVTWYASILPAVQNLMLAARARGLGTTLTTLPLAAHDALRSIGGVPDDVTLVACIPLGYPKGRFARPSRQPVEAVAWIDGVPLPSPASREPISPPQPAE